jgi:manganese/zinc/iron transport system permease protein
MQRVELILTTVLVLAIVTGLQTVGVVLMAAMVVAPAAAARQWTDRLGSMVWLAALFGGLAGVTGAVLSSTTTGLPTGPTIVLCASVIVGISLAFAPRRGLVWERVRARRRRFAIRRDTVLADLYALYRQHGDIDRGHPLPVIEAMSEAREGALNTLLALESDGLARLLPDGAWALTPDGRVSAEQRVAGLQPGNTP